MANVDLTNFYRKRNEKVSFVDSNIILNKKQTDTEIYSDVALDIEFGNIQERQLFAKENNRDLVKLKNEESVMNSLRNILNTHKNSRLLDPDVEFDLRTYLFDGLNPTAAWFIGYEICSRITLYEPRVTIENVNIGINWDQDCYIIDLTVAIPSLDTTVKLSSVLNKDGFVF